MNAAVRNLPTPLTWLAPELVETDLPEETRADCANCPMAGQPFHASVRCCTYEPALPNFLVGNALARGDTGSARVEARIRKGVGLAPLGLHPDPAWTEEYVAKRETDFGRNPDWRCPYWVEGPLSCSIWQDRNAVCRSWHCKHVDGFRGHRLWSAVRKLAANGEGRLARWCADTVAAPASPDPDAWMAYYRACATQVRQAAPADLAALVDDALAALRDEVRALRASLRDPMPDVVGVEVRSVIDHGEEVELVGYTPWDTARFPKTVFVLLAEIDGERVHTEALARARAADPSVQASWVQTLWDTGVLRARDAGDTAPWGFGGPDLDPDELEARFG